MELENLEVTPVQADTSSSPSTPESSSPELVKVVEKISGIFSPYFIVLVGLFLYDDNLWVGTALIFVGIFTLLKLSWADIQALIDKVKQFFQSKP